MIDAELVAAGVAYLEREKLDILLEIIKRNPRHRVERTEEFLLREVGIEKLLEWRALMEIQFHETTQPRNPETVAKNRARSRGREIGGTPDGFPRSVSRASVA